jgi:hypothetical protein
MALPNSPLKGLAGRRWVNPEGVQDLHPDPPGAQLEGDGKDGGHD